MDAALWRRASQLFDAALEVDAREREAWLEQACADDAALKSLLARWLAADAVADGFLDAAVDATPAFADDADAAPADLAGTRIGEYRALRCIGSGGMGEVWLAERVDGEFEQRVAIKRLLYPTPELIARFRRERNVLAGLQHPHIAALFDGGVAADGSPYFVMEYIAGRPITEHCATLDLPARIALFLDVCDAVQYAHRNLVVHRDLKPSNVLVSADGVVKLLDFGIAKVLEGTDRADATQTLVQRMTPRYAAPEQIRGEAVTTATDVYALGVLLCELIAGERPYRLGERRGDLAQAILRTSVQAPSALAARSVGQPREWARRLRGDLDRIVARALAKEPERRYATVQALADDLVRQRDGRPILARGDDAGYRMRRFIARHRALAAAIVIVALALVAATAVSVSQAARAERERRTAEKTRDFVIEMLSNVGPYRRSVSRSPTLARLVEDSAPRVLDEFAAQPEVQIPLLRAFAGVFLSLSRARDSGRYMELVLERQRATGAGAAQLAQTELAIANDDYYQRRFTETDRIADRVLAELAGASSAPEVDKLRYSAREMHLLAAWVRGDYAAAATVAAALRRDMRAAPQTEATELSSVENYSAYLELDLAHLEQAAGFIEDAARVDLASFPKGYPGNLGDANEIAWWLIAAGDAAAAETLATRVLDLRNRIYFGQGFAPAVVHFTRGWARCESGRLRDGLADLDAAITVFADAGNIGHMYLSRVRFREGVCRTSAGDLDAAAAAFAMTRELAVADGGEDAPLARAAAAGLARVDWQRGNRERAKLDFRALAARRVLIADAFGKIARAWFADAGVAPDGYAEAPVVSRESIAAHRTELVSLADRLAVDP